MERNSMLTIFVKVTERKTLNIDCHTEALPRVEVSLDNFD